MAVHLSVRIQYANDDFADGMLRDEFGTGSLRLFCMKLHARFQRRHDYRAIQLTRMQFADGHTFRVQLRDFAAKSCGQDLAALRYHDSYFRKRVTLILLFDGFRH
ncbi:hypothetical protein WT59_20765 [Burkholderia territorii]|nr:hypothetical protein WT59_20765 [Burkholderia territorii]